MHGPSTNTLAWSFRLIALIIAFWWPAVLRDPIYTPRHARLTGQELRLPPQVTITPDEAPVLAIFWNWEHRTLVDTHWFLGPYQGVRDPAGRQQTLIALLVFWVISSFFLSRWAARMPPPDGEQPRAGASLLLTPLWQWFGRRN